MTALAAEFDRLLRGQGRFRVGEPASPWRPLLLVVVLGAALHGAVMGSHGGRLLQSACSALKVPLLLLGSGVLVLPSFYVLNAVLGLRDDFAAACRGVLAAQAGMAAALASLAPLCAFWYACGIDHDLALLGNGVQFAVATLTGQIVLNRHYAALVQRNPRHRQVRYAWSLLYVFVAIQLAWVLRPYVGSPGLPVQFLREDAWSNAYVVVVDLVLRVLGGR